MDLYCLLRGFSGVREAIPAMIPAMAVIPDYQGA
jgi:hypothetical protein